MTDYPRVSEESDLDDFDNERIIDINHGVEEDDNYDDF